MSPEKRPSPGYLWRPGSSPANHPLHLVVALVIGLILVGCLVLAVVT